MKCMETLTKNIKYTLENLKKDNISFDIVAENLFSYDYQDYNEIFKIDQIEVPEKTYKRLPVFNNENCVAILMLWGVNNKTAVHDHKNYEGKIKVLKGVFHPKLFFSTPYLFNYLNSQNIQSSTTGCAASSLVSIIATIPLCLHVVNYPYRDYQVSH